MVILSCCARHQLPEFLREGARETRRAECSRAKLENISTISYTRANITTGQGETFFAVAGGEGPCHRYCRGLHISKSSTWLLFTRHSSWIHISMHDVQIGDVYHTMHYAQRFQLSGVQPLLRCLGKNAASCDVCCQVYHTSYCQVGLMCVHPTTQSSKVCFYMSTPHYHNNLHSSYQILPKVTSSLKSKLGYAQFHTTCSCSACTWPTDRALFNTLPIRISSPLS